MNKDGTQGDSQWQRGVEPTSDSLPTASYSYLATLGPRTRLRTSPIEGLHVAVLGWHGHAAQVRLVAHRLEVAAAQQKVYRARAAPLRQRQRLIDLVQLAVAAASHSHPHPASPGRGQLPAIP